MPSILDSVGYLNN